MINQGAPTPFPKPKLNPEWERLWDEKLAQFPTYRQTADGNISYWSVPPDTGDEELDSAYGRMLAVNSIKAAQDFEEASFVLDMAIIGAAVEWNNDGPSRDAALSFIQAIVGLLTIYLPERALRKDA